MKQEPLSPAQLQVLVWTGLLAPAMEAFPQSILPGAGRNAWISVLLGGALALGLGRLLASCGGCPAHELKRSLGRAGGTVFLLIYIVWFQLLLTLRLGLCAHRLLLWGGRDGSRLFFLTVLTLLVLRLASTPLTGFARASQLFFAALAAAGLLILVLALPAARLERLSPVHLPPLSPALTAGGILAAWGLPAAFLPVAYEGRHYRLRRDLLAVLVLALSQGIILANLGPGLSAQVDVPFFTLAKSVGVEGAFQRAESAVAALWIFSDLVLAGLLISAQRQILRELTDRDGMLLTGLILLAAIGAWAGTPSPAAALRLLPTAGLLLAVLPPVLIRMTEALHGG